MANLTTDTEREIAVPQNNSLVTVTVTKFGAGKVSTGEHVAGEGDIFASRGNKLEVSQSVADALEAKGMAEAD